MAKPRVWEVYALRYATVARRRLELFIMHDLHDSDAQMDYFVWYLQSEGETILIVETNDGVFFFVVSP